MSTRKAIVRQAIVREAIGRKAIVRKAVGRKATDRKAIVRGLGNMPLVRKFVAVILGIAWPVLFLPLGGTSAAYACTSPYCLTGGWKSTFASHAKHNPPAAGRAGTGSGSPVSSGTSPTSSPEASPSASPTPSGQPSPTPPVPSPTPAPPAGSACPSPSAFPTGYFAPAFTGPATRTFTQQYIIDAGSYVETCYPAGSSAPSSGVPGGAQARLPLSGAPSDDATLTYQIRFPVGYQWVKGGKLPGLCGGQCWTGSNNGPGGWAGRFMWRSGGAGEVLLSDATTTGYGTDLGLGSWHFQADGRWHTLSEHVHMNTPGQANGWIDVTYDGVAVAHFTGITFRTDSSTHIDSLMFSTFFGGHDSTWAPSAVMRIDFAAFQMT